MQFRGIYLPRVALDGSMLKHAAVQSAHWQRRCKDANTVVAASAESRGDAADLRQG